ncbi:MAG: hypothetical protein M3Q08_11415 [Pseudomonadota bacterium]|nr:hypothetical protein [Chloroflexota bacterium]MDP9414671.1 hypothetical protein [Pseudomonadota bacterium]
MHSVQFTRFLVGAILAVFTLVPAMPTRAAAPHIERFYNEGADLHLLDCGTFFVNGQFREAVTVTTFLDEAGTPVQLKVHVMFDGQLTNEATGTTLRDTSRETRFIDVHTGVENVVGLPWQWVIPEVGRVLLDAGNIVFDPGTGEVLFEAGRHPRFYMTDSEIDALICSALA